ncbi:MAG: transglycosylase SLT domain-containing protein [Rhodoferax sp.]|nr:transglycosylase SLT domain-containing protein [Rhodoferax sp.]
MVRATWLPVILLFAGCSSTGNLIPTTEPVAAAGIVQMATPAALSALPAPATFSVAAASASARAPNATPLLALESNRAASRAVAHLTPPADLWERIQRGYAMPDLESELVREREQWYATRPDYLQRMGERGRKYMFHIVEELERRNMPTELALLPFIESAFNPQAVSSAKAAGMWQFMPATGKHFELKQNAFRDDRRDVLASTRAALDYLQKLYGMFGDWHLALAAYNWGEGSVGRAIEKNRRAGLPTGYLDLNMPAETRHYVPKLQAMKNIVTTPGKFSATLPVIENHPYFQTVTITRDIDVAVAARLAQVGLEDFRALNPSASRPVILASGTPQILLPWDNAAIFTANLQLQKGGSQLASWTAWQAPTSMQPADAAKRVGMSETELRAVNRIPVGMLIQAGSTLLVVRSAANRDDVAGRVADGAQLSLSPLPILARQTVRAGKSDTVATIARRYKVTTVSVAEWNRVAASASFRPGQAVTIYAPAWALTAAPQTATSSVKAKTRASERTKGKPLLLAKR